MNVREARQAEMQFICGYNTRVITPCCDSQHYWRLVWEQQIRIQNQSCGDFCKKAVIWLDWCEWMWLGWQRNTQLVARTSKTRSQCYNPYQTKATETKHMKSVIGKRSKLTASGLNPETSISHVWKVRQTSYQNLPTSTDSLYLGLDESMLRPPSFV